MITITLERNHIEYATDLGHRRRQSGIERNRPAKNNCPADDRALQFDIQGALCECAAYLYLRPVIWHRFQDGGLKNLPDLDDWIDVKGRSKSWHDLIVQHDDQDHWAYLLIRSENHPTYEVVGWMFGSEAKTYPISDPAVGRPAHFVEQGQLRKPEVLLEKIRMRQALTPAAASA